MKLIVQTLTTIYFICCINSCVSESDEFIKKKLLIILEDDLKSAVKNISKEGLLDSTYYNIVESKYFKKGSYSHKAVVDFYFFKNVSVKMVRKYRYHVDYNKWERYFNEYKFYDIKKKN